MPEDAEDAADVAAEDALDWDLEERDRLLADGTLTDESVAAPVEVVVEADE